MILMSILFSLACVTPSGTLDVPGPGSVGAGGDDTGDTGEEQIEPHFAAGDYDGPVGWYMPEWDWTICEEDIEVTVDDLGNFEGSTVCVYVTDRGAEYDLPVQIDGMLDEDGDATGTIVFDTWAIEGYQDWYIDEREAELSGTAEDDELNLEFDLLVDMGDYYGDLEVSGWVELGR